MSLIDDPEEARRLARAIAADIELYNAAKIAQGGDLRPEIEEGRALYRSRVAPGLHASFDAVLAETRLGGGAPAPAVKSANKRGSARVLVGLVLVVAVPALAWRACRVPGEEVGEIAVPGSMELDLGAGDQLAFTADTDVVFARPSSKALPTGCVLDLALVRDGDEVAKTSCDPFRTSPSTNAATSSRAERFEGMTRLATSGQRLGCHLTAPSAGRATLRASSNLDRCVPRAFKAVTQVYLDRAPK